MVMHEVLQDVEKGLTKHEVRRRLEDKILSQEVMQDGVVSVSSLYFTYMQLQLRQEPPNW
jgi:hypothetical protein